MITTKNWYRLCLTFLCRVCHKDVVSGEGRGKCPQLIPKQRPIFLFLSSVFNFPPLLLFVYCFRTQTMTSTRDERDTRVPFSERAAPLCSAAPAQRRFCWRLCSLYFSRVAPSSRLDCLLALLWSRTHEIPVGARAVQFI